MTACVIQKHYYKTQRNTLSITDTDFQKHIPLTYSNKFLYENENKAITKIRGSLVCVQSFRSLLFLVWFEGERIGL